MSTYTKPHLTFEAQLALIESRGLNSVDHDFVRTGLERLGYYRLSAYWYPFRIRHESHREGIDTPESTVIPGYTLDDMIRICDFDGVLRNLLLAAVSQVEVAVRVAVAYETGNPDPFAYIRKDYWGPRADVPSQIDRERTQYEAFYDRHIELVNRSKEPFARHFRDTYGSVLPIWAAIELWDFGTLSRFFQVMSTDHRLGVARRFDLDSGKTFQGWLEALNDLRNFCAHHQRLNRRHFPISPSIPKSKELPMFHHVRWPMGQAPDEIDRRLHQLYPLMCVLSFVLAHTPMVSGWRTSMIAHFSKVPKIAGMSLADYGILEDWPLQDLWAG